MKATFSKGVLAASGMVALLTIVAAWWWIHGLLVPPNADVDQEAYERGAMNLVAFLYLVAPALGGISLVCLILSGIFFFRQRQRRDLWSLCLSGGSLVALIAQVAFFWFKA